ncbi:MAG: hypothetical protein AB8G22_13260 [Saprospiraceae bacterium]
MNIRQQLLLEHSKLNTQAIVDYIDDNKTRFGELMDIFLNGNLREVQRASWVVSVSGKNYPKLVLPYLPDMVNKLKHPQHNAVRRNVVRLFQYMDLPESILGEVVDICFTLLNDPQEAIANRAFSMTVLYNACLREPLLADELKATIEMHMEEGSAGFKSRGKKILKQLSSLKS